MNLLTHTYNLLTNLFPSRSHRIRIFILNASGCKIASGVAINYDIKVAGNAIEIQENTWLSIGSRLVSSYNWNERIKIGRNCDIGPFVVFQTGTHVIGNSERRAGKGKSLPITIGDGTWVGARATILGGVNIGEGCVVGACSLVLPGDYPKNSLLVGVPAKVIRKLE
jgi:maltose O-acetyltransferase